MKPFLNSIISFLMILLPVFGCSSQQHLITGEPIVYGIDGPTGNILDRDVFPSTNRIIPHNGEIIAIAVNSIFLKFVKELGSPHVLVYTEVYDDGSDNPETAFKKVLFNALDQPSGVNLGLSDRIIYGPTTFKGYPIRIKFYIVELDKEDKELASKIINSIGGIGATAQPQAAAAVGLAVQVAETINAMNRDDFELRFDLTLYPVDQIGQSDINDTELERPPVEPIQRNGKFLSLLSSLRTGSFVILKRELEQRLSGNEDSLESALMFDYTQEFFINNYATPEGEPITSEEILRYQGGYLYRIVRQIKDKNMQVIPGNATVKLRKGPNRLVNFSLGRGIRQIFKDQTYVVLSVLNGLPQSLDQNEMRNSSNRDMANLVKFLDNPNRAPLTSKIGDQVDKVSLSMKTILEQRNIAEMAAKRVGRDATFRTSVEYPIFWIQNIELLTSLAKDSPGWQNAVAKNAGILATLSDLVLNLPFLQPDELQKMKNLKRLNKESFEVIPNKGLFKLKQTALQTLL